MHDRRTQVSLVKELGREVHVALYAVSELTFDAPPLDVRVTDRHVVVEERHLFVWTLANVAF